MPSSRYVLFGLFACLVVLSACESGSNRKIRHAAPGNIWISTAEKYLPLAMSGQAEYQNLLGFMLFFGEGIERDPEEAHVWFHLAAEAGHPTAQRNLAVLHQLGLGVDRNL